MDWNGNLSWLKNHFSKTPLKNIVPFMLATVLILEIGTAILSIIGIFHIINSGSNTIAFYGAILACIIF